MCQTGGFELEWHLRPRSESESVMVNSTWSAHGQLCAIEVFEHSHKARQKRILADPRTNQGTTLMPPSSIQLGC